MSALHLKSPTARPSDFFVSLDQQILALLEIGNYNQAEFALRQALAIDPSDFKTLYFLGYCVLHQQRHAEAIDFFSRVIALQPKFADSYGAIGNCYRILGYLTAAESYFRKAVQRAPRHPLYHSNLGDTLFQQGKIHEAKASLLRAVSLNSQDADAQYNLAVVYSMLGNQKKKLRHALLALDARPSHGRAFYLLSLDNITIPDKALCETMERQLWDSGIPVTERMYMYFGLGHVHENAGDYDTAFFYFSQGNHFKKQSTAFNSTKYAAYAASISNAFQSAAPAVISEIEKMTVIPVFIVGMPRSGTTLIEQILHQHRSIHGAGEQLFIEQLIAQHERQSGIPYPNFMQHITPETLAGMGAAYLAQLCRAAGKNAPFIIDKLPGNFMHIGFIKAILPQAKFIYCTRHYLDTALSIFRQDFSGHIPYAYDLEHIGAASAVCMKTMQEWKSLLGDASVLEVAYEDIIRDTPSEIEKMLRFLGLGWEEKCLEFHKDWRLVKTASYDQVRRPIYHTSAGKHRHYEKHLEPVTRAFGAFSNTHR